MGAERPRNPLLLPGKTPKVLWDKKRVGAITLRVETTVNNNNNGNPNGNPNHAIVVEAKDRYKWAMARVHLVIGKSGGHQRVLGFMAPTGERVDTHLMGWEEGEGWTYHTAERGHSLHWMDAARLAAGEDVEGLMGQTLHALSVASHAPLRGVDPVIEVMVCEGVAAERELLAEVADWIARGSVVREGHRVLRMAGTSEVANQRIISRIDSGEAEAAGCGYAQSAREVAQRRLTHARAIARHVETHIVASVRE